jgi:hypothetical protein
VISAVFGGIISCAGYLCDFVSEWISNRLKNYWWFL